MNALTSPNEQKILALLRNSDPGRLWHPTEIARATGIPESSLRAALSRLVRFHPESIERQGKARGKGCKQSEFVYRHVDAERPGVPAHVPMQPLKLEKPAVVREGGMDASKIPSFVCNNQPAAEVAMITGHATGAKQWVADTSAPTATGWPIQPLKVPAPIKLVDPPELGAPWLDIPKPCKPVDPKPDLPARVDYAAVLADLRAKRKAIDDAIEALQRVSC